MLNTQWRGRIRFVGKSILYVVVALYLFLLYVKIDSIESEVSSIQSDVSEIQSNVSSIESEMPSR